MSEIAEGARTMRQREALETLRWRVSADEGRVGGVITPPSESLMAHQKSTSSEVLFSMISDKPQSRVSCKTRLLYSIVTQLTYSEKNIDCFLHIDPLSVGADHLSLMIGILLIVEMYVKQIARRYSQRSANIG